jgi:predicted XRE-type DNA-binding protein
LILSKDLLVEEGSGNVFADLGLPDADELLAKAHLLSRIAQIIKGRHLTQNQAAEVLETTQPIVSNLMNGRISGFSLERLVRFLNALDRDVEIVVRRKTRGDAKARVKVQFTG